MGELDHECIICGAKYHYCDSCKRMENTYSPWRSICDTSQHYQLYMIIRDYNAQMISGAQAKEMLRQIGINSLSDAGTLKDSTRKALTLILDANEKRPKSKVKKD